MGPAENATTHFVNTRQSKENTSILEALRTTISRVRAMLSNDGMMGRRLKNYFSSSDTSSIITNSYGWEIHAAILSREDG